MPVAVALENSFVEIIAVCIRMYVCVRIYKEREREIIGIVRGNLFGAPSL